MEKTKKKDLPVISSNKGTTKRNDFVELKFTGYANGEVFDSNIEEDLKKINPKAEVKKTIVVIGQKMVVDGLDKALEDKEIGKNYEVDVPCKEGFGVRDRNLIRTIPLKAFAEQKVEPRAGMVLALDNHIVKILAVSGARVTTDFNNLLAGKDLKYKFRIVRKVTDDKEKAEALLELFFRFVPEFEIKEKKVIVKAEKGFDKIIELYKEKFKEIIGLDLEFEEKAKVKDEKISPEKEKLEEKVAEQTA